MQEMVFRVKSSWKHILGLLLAALIGLFVAQMLAIGVVTLCSDLEVIELFDTSSKAHLSDEWRRWGLFVAGFSSLGAFIVAPLLYLHYVEPVAVLRDLLFRGPKSHALLLGLLITLLFMFANAQTVEWNKSLQLPEQLSNLEEWMHNKEAQAEQLIEHLTQMPTVWDFLATLCVVALLPALGEELLFRGILQRQLVERFNHAHLAIWSTALMFSFFHLQFYGFVPRLLLGALFGYMYFFSGNWWLAASGHFINNGLVVSALYIEQNTDSKQMLGAQEVPAPWISAVALGLMLCLMYLLYRITKKTPSRRGWTQIYAAQELHRAEIVRDCFHSKELEVVLINEKDSTFTWGSYKIYVKKEKAKEAQRILSEELDFI